MKLTYMGIDQHGDHYDDLGPYPRKELLKRLGRKSARKMYVDTKNGTAKHIGWIIAGKWIHVLKVEPLK